MEEKKILESWKEVSDYLKHSIKTCQRWEREFGLPIHRFEKVTKGRIFANKAEIDTWIKNKLRIAEASEKGIPAFHSLAVLPVRNLCGDREKDYFSEGITEALITELGQIRPLRIISHQSVRQFQATEKTIPEIARLLRVEALVEGAVFQIQGRVRLSLNLVDAFPEGHVWAQNYECGPSEVAGLMRRIACTVAQQAGVVLTPEVEDRPYGIPTVNPESYEAYLRGRAFARKSFLKADVEGALGYFMKSIEFDPKFAPAYAEKSWAYGQLGKYSHLSPRVAFPKQKEAAQRALELDPFLAEGYAELGFAAMIYDWEWRTSEKYLERALELNPNSQRTHFYSTIFLGLVSRNEEAIAMQQRLLDLDPLNPESHWNMGWTYFWAGRYDEATAVFEKLQEHSPGDHWLEMALGVIYSIKKMPDQAITMCNKARSGVPMGVDCAFDCFTAIICAMAAEKKKAYDILEELKAISKKRIIDFACLAGVYVALGDTEEAVRWLEKSFQEKSPMLAYLNVAPFWKPLFADPRCQSILSQINFPGVHS